MRKISFSDFRTNINSELDFIDENDDPIIIKLTKVKGNIVVLSEAAFTAMEETGYLLSTEANSTRGEIITIISVRFHY